MSDASSLRRGSRPRRSCGGLGREHLDACVGRGATLHSDKSCSRKVRTNYPSPGGCRDASSVATFGIGYAWRQLNNVAILKISELRLKKIFFEILHNISS